MLRSYIAGCVVLVVSLASQASLVSFGGVLNESLPCSIGNDAVMEVDFGEAVVIKKIDGVQYRHDIAYQITCSASANLVRLSFEGVPVAFDTSAVQTSVAGLGIRLLRDGQPFMMNTPVTVDMQNLPVLSVVPVVPSDPTQWPSPGGFSALATLRADYQ